MPVAPPRWTVAEIEADTVAAANECRKQRFAEPLEAWLREVDKRSAEFTALFDEHDIASPLERQQEYGSLVHKRPGMLRMGRT